MASITLLPPTEDELIERYDMAVERIRKAASDLEWDDQIPTQGVSLHSNGRWTFMCTKLKVDATNALIFQTGASDICKPFKTPREAMIAGMEECASVAEDQRSMRDFKMWQTRMTSKCGERRVRREMRAKLAEEALRPKPVIPDSPLYRHVCSVDSCRAVWYDHSTASFVLCPRCNN